MTAIQPHHAAFGNTAWFLRSTRMWRKSTTVHDCPRIPTSGEGKKGGKGLDASLTSSEADSRTLQKTFPHLCSRDIDLS